MANPRHIVFGTAGHVDHGKSALVFALTGTDPDRLAEEKAREMTIDLGFAFLSLPGLEEPVAIVDVPGHEMFVRNMVTGATGIDAAIFVVAADEGVMPQTEEHLDVLSSLNLSAGVVALTKADKASPERIREVSADVMRLLKGTFLENAKVLPVSSVSGEGVPGLREALAGIAASVRMRPATGIFRLPIDRVFTIKGAGTVVTGTVVSGSLQTGEKIECLPQGKTLRSRGLHVHNQPVEEIAAGQRAAINLADIEKEDIHRGDMLATPGSISPTLMIDVRVNLSQRAPKPLVQRTRLRVHHGTKEVMARIVLLEGETLNPGESGLCQLRLESPLAAAAEDAFVLRTYSPMRVIGGGTIVDPHPPKRKKAAGADGVAQRESLPVNEVVLEMLDGSGANGLEFKDIRANCGLSVPELRSCLQELQREGQVHAGRRERWFSANAIKDIEMKVVEVLAQSHRKEPLRALVPLNLVIGTAAPAVEQREGLRLALESLVTQGTVVSMGDRMRLAGHQPQWSGPFAAARENILAEILRSGLAAPSPAELAAAAGLKETDCQRVLEALVEAGELHLLASGIYIHPEVFTNSRAAVIEFLRQNQKMSIADARDLLKASRKYLLPFLEQLDREGVTRREGDYRVLAEKDTAQ